MPGFDMTQYVTRAELQPLAEIRTMLRDDMRGLHEGQIRLAEKVDDMNTAICARMDEANGRTSKLEQKLDATELEVVEARDVAKTVLENGCRQKERHVIAVNALAKAGVLDDDSAYLMPGEEARVEFVRDQPLRSLVQRHPKKSMAVGGGALVGLGALLPHLIQFLDWFVHLFVPGVK